MSEMSKSKGLENLYNNLLFTNQKINKANNNRDFSPDFQSIRQKGKSDGNILNSSPKNKEKCHRGSTIKKEKKVKL